ncbi:hypothetical protein F0M18_14370 [Pseudohalioglobus sediminis]|uniref:Uncharacterized protein n=1 Tax=Pseudohalioglobus sediminis TaxID=2606449 RepID=A0A5B0WSS8_9GAMM|nr:hypothetical protein [Pseudohalioglobus sediminis]KAA1189538.1 hypothetical protein F0M18_14370 [Pseudohalioglobus sediminis]
MDSSDKEARSPRRRGRPPAPPGVSRNHRVVTFVNDAEFERLHELARRDDETLSMAAYRLLTKELNAQQ